MHHKTLISLPTFDGELLRAVIETPKGSRTKYDYNPEHQCFEYGKALPEGMNFPFDFGFIPQTLGDDGDPVDILVLMDAPALMGCVVKTRLLGAIKAEQKEKGGSWERNDRLIAVAEKSRLYEEPNALADLREGLVAEIADFFEQYNKIDGKKFRSLGSCGAKAALTLVEQGVKKFRKKR
jgi:inorganic pyrophosphatase